MYLDENLFESVNSTTENITKEIIRNLRKLGYMVKTNPSMNKLSPSLNIIRVTASKGGSMPNPHTNVEGIQFDISDGQIRFRLINVIQKQKGTGLTLVKTVLDKIPEDFIIQVAFDESDGFWDYISEKYFSKYTWYGLKSQEYKFDNIDKKDK